MIKIRIARTDLSVPVIAEAKHFQLLAECFNIIFRKLFRMMSCLDSILFCRQAKTVKAHRMQNIVSLHALHAADDICCCISFRMSSMQTDTGWIWEHIQRIILRLREIMRICAERLMIRPVFLPFLFYRFMIIHINFLLA